MKQQIKFDHLNLTVNNFEKTKSWYKKIFNFQLVEQGVNSEGLPWGILKSGDQMLVISETPIRKQYDGNKYHKINHFSFRIDNQNEWEEILKKYNLETYYQSPVHYPNSTSWYVQDPSGYQIEISIWNNNKVVFN